MDDICHGLRGRCSTLAGYWIQAIHLTQVGWSARPPRWHARTSDQQQRIRHLLIRIQPDHKYLAGLESTRT